MRAILYSFCITTALVFISCNQGTEDISNTEPIIKGKLFIIGGGKRPVELIDRMLDESGVRNSGYILVLPMASGEEDSAVYYSSKQFTDLGMEEVYAFKTEFIKQDPDSCLKLIKHASLIYISGGDQNRFMEVIEGTEIKEAMQQAYITGATIAGSSAGAALMSSKMITGNEIKHPEYTGNFPTIEANNIEIKPGLGFLKDVIIDQHFIKRQRMNRLISVSLENPENLCIGIDESTAIIVQNQQFEVVGQSQVITLRHTSAETKIVNGLLGGKDLSLSIYLAGDFFGM